MDTVAERKAPSRVAVPPEHCWNLEALYPDNSAWERDFARLGTFQKKIPAFKGSLGESAARLKTALDFKMDLEALTERLQYYAFLRVAEDGGDSEHQGRQGRILQSTATCQAAFSYFVPELQALPETAIRDLLADPELEPYRIFLEKVFRYKPHVLSEAEERLLAMQSECAAAVRQGFDALNDVDLSFESVDTPEGPRELTHSSFHTLIQHPSRGVRSQAFHRMYAGYDQHKHTLAALLAGSVRQDIFEAKARRFASCLEGRLFPGNIPVPVYDNLIQAVRANLAPLHRYYGLRKKILKLDSLAHFDVRVPLLDKVRMHHTFAEAVAVVLEALHPLGENYQSVLSKGLLGGWVDRHENQGKASGAFSAGSFHGDPYILLNFKEDALDDVFTLAHEAGHSMHSWYSIRSNPFQHYHYTIFVAEVASTFNEQLLGRHLMEQATDPRVRAYLLGKQIDDVVATLYRQTMFAEFEKEIHAAVERGDPLTVETLRALYRSLLGDYFGPEVELLEWSDLECFRIPHFYSAFYVYQYATGVSAALALAERVLAGGEAERAAYLSFLKSGGSRYPLEQLRDAGVDMTSPEPVQAALRQFAGWVGQLETALNDGAR